MNIRKKLTIVVLLFLSAQVKAVGLYDATYENNQLLIPVLKAGEEVYEVTMVLDQGYSSSNPKCAEICFRLTSAQDITNISTSAYSIYDELTSVLMINNLWYQGKAYEISLKFVDETGGAYYFALETAKEQLTYPLFRTSYENKNHLNVPTQSIPIHWTKGGIYFANDNAYGFADFFQDGTLSFFKAQLTYSPARPTSEITPSLLSFWRINSDGERIEDNLGLLSESDSVGCTHPRKAVIADFNNDMKPDIWLACSGYDAPPFTRENQSLLLSQNSGVYKTLEIQNSNYYAHGAAAADINDDGWTDILNVGGSAFFYINNGDGTFSEDRTRILNASQKDDDYVTGELVDVNDDGFVDIVLGGGGFNEAVSPVKIIYNDGNGVFAEEVTLPVSEDDYNLTLDLLVEQGFAYLLQTRTAPFNYKGSSVKKVNLETMEYEVIFKSEDKSGYNTIVESQHNPYINGIPPTDVSLPNWIDWIVPYRNRIVSPSIVYALDVPL